MLSFVSHEANANQNDNLIPIDTISMAKIKLKSKQKTVSVAKVVKQVGLPDSAGERGNWCNHYRNLFDGIHKTEYTHSLRLKDSTLRYIYPTKTHMYVHQYTCTRMCISALFVVE